jgi:hypothetical protein
MSDTNPKTTKANPTPAAPSKREEYPPLPPGQPGNPRNYVPVKVDGRKNPRKKEAIAVREKKALKRGKPRQLPPLDLTRKAYTEIFGSVEQIEQAANDYRDECQESGDLPTINGFCLSCGCGGSLLAGYIDGPNKDLAQAAQAVADWILEQMDQTTFRGNCAVAYAQHMGVNQHNRVNSRTYSEANNSTVIKATGDFAHLVAAPEVMDMISQGPKPVKRIKQAKVIEHSSTPTPRGTKK